MTLYGQGKSGMGTKVTTFTFIIAAAFALEACGQLESMPGAGMLPCNNGVCKAEVTVANNDCSNAANIKVVPDPLPVPKGNPHNLEWTVQEGFTWVAPPGGITSLPSSIFTNHQLTGNGRKYSVHDANPETTPTNHKYDVHLQKDGALCAVKDPTIRNGS
jgi:hypothetical protein